MKNDEKERTMKHDEKERTMKHDEKERKNNETWWKREEQKQGSMMKNRVTTMKNDEK